MKKVAIFLVVVMSVTLTFGQSAKVQSAYNYLKNGKLDKAKENIDLAAQHEKTIGKAKTWFYLGNIYQELYASEDEEYKKLADNALDIAYDGYKKALELDQKDEFKEKIQFNLLNNIAIQYYHQALAYYEADEFIKASNSFLSSKEINESFGGLDSLATYNAAFCAEYGDDMDKAIELYSKLVEIGYERPVIYTALSNIYKGRDDYDNALEVILVGRDRYPGDINIIIAETNLYLDKGNSAKALESLKLGLELEKDNPTIYFAVGAQYNIIVDDTSKTEEVREKAFDAAVEAYLRAIELDPDYFNANYNLGAIYVNKASEIMSIANELPLGDPEYDVLKDEAFGLLRNAKPYLEKASEIDPEDLSTLVTLKEIYARLGGFDEKLKVVDEKLKSM
ncbi:MAG: tetratricopeptide repeat protein [Bacteroidales bacterium]|nr:tetratricopeptide repeat protein [Bacteroidales bacterium]